MAIIFTGNTLRILVSIIVGLTLGSTKVQSATEREWTVMVYMNAKNNLEEFALSNFHSMASVGSTPAVSIVAQLGRPSSIRYTTEDGDWSGVYRFLVSKNMAPRVEQAVVDVAAVGESTDMGSPLALKQFIQWAKREYPARHFMLIIWNHGQGWRFQLAADPSIRKSTARSPLSHDIAKTIPLDTPSVGGYRAVSSDNDTGKILYNREVQDVIETEFSTSKLDILGFDACLMAMIETAYGVAPWVKVMVGSEELEPADGWRYSSWLGKLSKNPIIEPEELSTHVVKSYAQQYGNEKLTTLSALRMSEMGNLAAAISEFSTSVIEAGPNELDAMRKARASIKAYGASVMPPLLTSVDIAALFKAYEGKTTNAALKAASAKVRALLAELVIENYASTRSQYPRGTLPYGSEGLAIYYPESKQAFDNDDFSSGYLKTNTDRPVDFVQKEAWVDLLHKLLQL